MFRTRVLTEIAELEKLREPWIDLLARSSMREPFSTPTWLIEWWRVFGPLGGRALRVVVCEEGHRLVGIVPFLRRLVFHRGIVPVRVLELLGTGENEADETCSEYVGAIVETGAESACAHALARMLHENALGRWDALRLTAMSGDDPFVGELMRAVEPSSSSASVRETSRCPYVKLPATWDAYLTSLDGGQRYAVTRALRDLEKWAGEGNVRFVVAETPADLARGRVILLALHAERWSERGQDGVFSSERFTRFHDAVMPRLFVGAEAGLELSWLEVRGEPIAASYNLLYGGKVRFYQSGRKLDVPKQIRPGLAIHAFAIRRSIELGRTEYDFLAGASQYKRKLATSERSLVELVAVAPTVRSRVVEAVRAGSEQAVAALRAWRGRREEMPERASREAIATEETG
jgi:CelD/BcsL family acetyltransferase involved in cellulose biosynthesis